MWQFAAIVFVVVLVLFIRLFWVKNFDWFGTHESKRILFGLVAAPLVALLLAFIGGCASKNTVSVFAGIENTHQLSPMCDRGGASDRATSNLGLEYAGELTQDGRTKLLIGYRHHSCAISDDAESYDAWYLGGSRELWVWFGDVH